MMTLNETHAPDIRSWEVSANSDDTDFPLQNLPYCVFQKPGETARIGMGIGRQILDLTQCAQSELLTALSEDIVGALQQTTLNEFMSLGYQSWHSARTHFFSLLQEEGAWAEKAKRLADSILVPQSDVKLLLPLTVGDFTDFECSHYHSARMRKLMSGATKPLANGYYLPRAYHGRSSSVVVSESPIYLPVGQIEQDNETPAYNACGQLDYELELGIVMGAGNERGCPIPIDEAEQHIFGVCLLNDWSARDIQHWERLPLGPFLGKNHATMISPWIVTLEALAPFRSPQTDPGEGWPLPLPYLHSERNIAAGGLDVNFDIFVTTQKMREQGLDPYKTSSNRFLDAHWTMSQFVAQHTSGGCNLRPGDLIGSGTVSGPEVHASACLMELTEKGNKPFELPNGETRGFLQVGDEVVFKGVSTKTGYPRIGFGECKGRVAAPRFQF
jgi:fumarylacetoacetase